MKIQRVIAIFFLLALLSSCGQAVEKSPTPTPFSTPEAGKATVVGTVFSTTTNARLPEVAVWLAEVVRQGDQGVYVLDSVSSPGRYTDENGAFVLMNVEPKEYVIVVGDPEGNYEVIRESSGLPKVWNIPADQIYEIGELKVALSKQRP